MKPVFIALCGASDIRRVIRPFNTVVKDFNCMAGDYLNGTTFHSFSTNYENASIRTIEEADIVVFNILDYYGNLTWGIEFYTTIMLKKPFIIMIEEGIYKSFEKSKHNLKIHENNDDSLSKLYMLIASLISDERSFSTFDIDIEGNYREVLRREISYIFFQGLECLKKSWVEDSVLNLIKNGGDDFAKNHILTNDEDKLLKKVLFNKSKTSKVREPILRFYAIKKTLTDEEIIELLNNGGQIITRVTIDLLPNLITADNNIDNIFESIISICKLEKDEVAKINRLIPSLLKADATKAIFYLNKLFPANRINAPIRILQGLNDYFESYKSQLNNASFFEALNNLAESSKNYDSKDNRLTLLYDDLINKISLIKI